MKTFKTDSNGSDFMSEDIYEGYFDQSKVFSYTITTDEEGFKDSVIVVFENAVQMKLEYDEETVAGLASEFRKRNVI